MNGGAAPAIRSGPSYAGTVNSGLRQIFTTFAAAGPF